MMLFDAVAWKAEDDFDDEDTCHEGNVDLLHLKNIYDQAREGLR